MGTQPKAPLRLPWAMNHCTFGAPLFLIQCPSRASAFRHFTRSVLYGEFYPPKIPPSLVRGVLAEFPLSGQRRTAANHPLSPFARIIAGIKHQSGQRRTSRPSQASPTKKHHPQGFALIRMVLFIFACEYRAPHSCLARSRTFFSG